MIAAPLILLLLPLPAPFVPESADLCRFPDRLAAADGRSLAIAYREHLKACLALRLHAHEWLETAQNEANRRATLWDILDDAHRFQDPWDLRAMEKLYWLLGPDAYYRGQMPDPVPLWCFTEIP